MPDFIQYPIFFNRNRVKRVYQGGLLFSDFLGDKKEDTYYPEEWIASTVSASNKDAKPLEGLSTIKGTNILFKKLLEQYPGDLLGPYASFDILVKYLDSAIRLPIQVHPDKDFSQKYFHCTHGKTEMWLILATRRDACIYLGFKNPISKEVFSNLIEKSLNDKNILVPLLNRIPVKTGDVFLIPAKTIHAIGPGCMLLEVQEPTDFTIQPEYWCDNYPMTPTERYLGLSKDIALDCFDFSSSGTNCILSARKSPRLIQNSNGLKEELLISYKDTPCFQASRFLVTNASSCLYHAPALYIISKGEGVLFSDNYKRQIKMGDYFFLPYKAKSAFHISTSSFIEYVECLPPYLS